MSAFDSPTFRLDMSIKVEAPVGAMSISPSSRDVVLASRQGLHIIDLDNPWDRPRFLAHVTAWSVADVQWSPHASHAHWVASTSNHRAVVWNLALPAARAIEHVLQSHTRAITDINFSAHDPRALATCAVDSFVHVWDLRAPRRPAVSFADWAAAATQVKFNRQDPHVLASAHDRFLYVWDTRMGARAVRRITAHSTKIYGVDWNRTRPTGIVTCALDKSVKFWDTGGGGCDGSSSSSSAAGAAAEDVPERVIHTAFPVWRARHTPFGWGVLTMPQRGDTSLYLWDRRQPRRTAAAAAVAPDGSDQPVAKFEGHTDKVKEFLWRWRGGQRDDGGDGREFQLVTWSLDKDIRLWDVGEDVMARIGHDPRKKMRFRVTRQGAPYVTFRSEAPALVPGGGDPSHAQTHALAQTQAQTPQAQAQTQSQSEAQSQLQSPTPTLADGDTARQQLLPRLTLTTDGARIRKSGPPAPGGIGQQLGAGAKAARTDDDRRFERALSGSREGGFMRVGRRRPTELNPIAWMRGVRIARKASDGGSGGSGMGASRNGRTEGSRASSGGAIGIGIGIGTDGSRSDGSSSSAHGAAAGLALGVGGASASGWDAPETLGDEISHVGSKFGYIAFEKVNVQARTCTLSLTGPWGAGAKRIFVRADVAFPADYPADGHSIPEFRLEKTSSISAAAVAAIDHELRRIAAQRVQRRRGCLEACLCFLLGEPPTGPHSDADPDSSSDDEQIVGAGPPDDDDGLAGLVGSAQQPSVPRPKTCAAVWAPDGRLVCFFPPRPDGAGAGARMLPATGRSLLSSLAAREAGSSRFPASWGGAGGGGGGRAGGGTGGGGGGGGGGNRIWEGFGRLYRSGPHRRRRGLDTDDGGDDSDFSSISSSSDDDDDDDDSCIHRVVGPLRTSFGWRLQGHVSSLGRGSSSSPRRTAATAATTATAATVTATTTKRKSVVSIHDLAHMLPAKRVLAQEYRIGEGADVCRHNALVAARHGFADLAHVWRLVELLLHHDVPLQAHPGGGGGGDRPVMVMAPRPSLLDSNTNSNSHRDSGLDMDFDDDDDFGHFDGDEADHGADFEADGATGYWGRVQWGGHPLGGQWLVRQLLDHYERAADIQMLAMLGCALSEADYDHGRRPPVQPAGSRGRGGGGGRPDGRSDAIVCSPPSFFQRSTPSFPCLPSFLSHGRARGNKRAPPTYLGLGSVFAIHPLLFSEAFAPISRTGMGECAFLFLLQHAK